MILVAFLLFALLIAAWVVAPSGERATKPTKAPAPLLTVSEAGAD